MRIDRGIPIPKRAKRNQYPFGRMEIGDSVFFPDEPKGNQSNPAVGARVYRRRHGKVFTTRVENGGVRIWRVS